MEHYDIIVVGTGFCGATVANLMARSGKRVLMLERRMHVAGNMYDEAVEGILVQRYGPHTFHTNNDKVFQFVSQFGEWEPYYLRCQAVMNGKATPSPFNFKTIDDFYSPEEAARLKKRIAQVYPGESQKTILELLESPDELIRGYAQFLFKNDYEPYTCKQWGISPAELDISVLRRVPVLFSYQERYFSDKYQMMPKHGFTKLFRLMLDHENITIKLGTDALKFFSVRPDGIYLSGERTTVPIVYTGAIDELFQFCYGELPYRSLRFEYKTLPIRDYQDAPIVAYPQEKGYTRITEYTKLPVQEGLARTFIAVEYPLQYDPKQGHEPYYPVPCDSSHKTYQQYLERAKRYANLHLCGRLADYRYYNMDQAIARALFVTEQLLDGGRSNHD